MDVKDLATIAGTALAGVSASIGYLKYRLDKMMAIQSHHPKIAKPYVMVKHTQISCSGYPTKNTVTVEIANREDRDIAVKSIHWWVESIRTRWDFVPNQQSPNSIDQLPHKLATSELFQCIASADHDNFKSILGPLENMAGLERSMAICNLSIEVTLTTGECIILRAPFTLRGMLIDYNSTPYFMRPFFKWYIDRHP